MNLNQLIQSKQYERAINECKALIADAELDDDKSAKLTGLVYLGIIYSQQGLYHKSKNIFDTYFNEIVSECKFYWSGKELIDTYIHYNESNKAELYCDAYLENNKDYKALLTKGNLLFKRNEYSYAIDILQQANNLNPDNKHILFSLGLSFFKQNNNQEALKHFEKSFDLGLEKSISEIVKILFTRTGYCDYDNCTDCCCKGVLLKGSDGKTINNKESFNQLIANDSRNLCWTKDRENSKGTWVFECKNLKSNNYCSDYDMRPNTCRDYPSSILTSRSACSYIFQLKSDSLNFSSKNTLKVVLHILKAYQYDSEMNQLINKNKALLS